MRICLICETGLHILNCINYVVNTLPEEYPAQDVTKDLYIVKSNRIQNEWIKNIKASSYFDNVFVFSYPSYDLNRLSEPLKKVKRIINPRKYVCQYSSIGRKIYEVKYDYIYMAYLTRLTYAMTSIFPSAGIRYFEDGLGTYINSLDHLGIFKKYVLFWLRLKRSPWKQIDRLYVNNVEMCKCDDAKEIIGLKSLTSVKREFILKLNEIFEYERNDLYKNTRMVVLTQPYPQSKKDVETNRRIQNIIKIFDSSAIIRFHPAEHSRESELYVDNTNNMWELVCGEEITEEHILIGEFSTAQLAPKICYDKEPYLIFTYKLFPNHFTEGVFGKISFYVDYLANFYKNNEKIFIPETIDDMERILKQLLL